MELSMTGQEQITFEYRWLLNRGDRIDRFHCTYISRLHNQSLNDLIMNYIVDRHTYFIFKLLIFEHYKHLFLFGFRLICDHYQLPVYKSDRLMDIHDI